MSNEMTGAKHPRWKNGITKPLIKRICEWCGNEFFRSQKVISLGKGRFCSNACTGHYHRGAKAKNWRGGLSLQYRRYGTEFNTKFRNDFKEKFQYTCQECGMKGVKNGSKLQEVDIHHVNGVKKDNSLTNLIVLCKTCHGKKHSYSLKIFRSKSSLVNQLN